MPRQALAPTVNSLNIRAPVVQKQHARLRALRFRRGITSSRSTSRPQRCGGDPSIQPQYAQPHGRVGTGSKRSRSDAAGSEADQWRPGSSCSALVVTALLPSAPGSILAGRHSAVSPSMSPQATRSCAESEPAGVTREGASGGDTRAAAHQPAELSIAADDAARDAKAAQLHGQCGGSMPLADANPIAQADSRSSREQSTHVDMSEPGVASALRDLTDQVQNLRTSAAAAQQEARRAEKAVSCCAHDPATLPLILTLSPTALTCIQVPGLEPPLTVFADAKHRRCCSTAQHQRLCGHSA